MHEHDFSEIWHRLPAQLRTRLVETGGCALTYEDIHELRDAGARLAEAYWLDEGHGRPRVWRTSTAFQRFVDQVGCAGPARHGGRGLASRASSDR